MNNYKVFFTPYQNSLNVDTQIDDFVPYKDVSFVKDVPSNYIPRYNLSKPAEVKSEQVMKEPEVIQEIVDTPETINVTGKYSDNLNVINSELKKANFTKTQRAAILATVIAESSGNNLAVGDNGLAKGLFQGHPNRFKASNDLQSQIELIINELRDVNNPNSGSNSKKYSKQQAIDAFNNGSLYDAIAALTYNFIRPKDAETGTNKRYDIAQKLFIV